MPATCLACALALTHSLDRHPPPPGAGFTGPLPAGLASSRLLRYLDLSGNSLSGGLPPLPPQLQYLNVSFNMLGGERRCGGGSACHFVSHRSLRCAPLSTSHAGTIANIPVSLRQLDAASNNLTGAIPSQLARAANLTFLDLSDNSLR